MLFKKIVSGPMDGMMRSTRLEVVTSGVPSNGQPLLKNTAVDTRIESVSVLESKVKARAGLPETTTFETCLTFEGKLNEAGLFLSCAPPNAESKTIDSYSVEVVGALQAQFFFVSTREISIPPDDDGTVWVYCIRTSIRNDE